jgi:hypothetical protein
LNTTLSGAIAWAQISARSFVQMVCNRILWLAVNVSPLMPYLDSSLQFPNLSAALFQIPLTQSNLRSLNNLNLRRQ